MFNPCSEKQAKSISHNAEVFFIGGACGGGKALRHGEKVLTQKGFVNIECINIDDKVITPTGEVEKVIAVYPQGLVDIYRLVFKDGATVDSCANHRWSINRAGEYRRKSKIYTTSEIQDILLYENNKEGRGRRWPLIELTNSVDFGRDYNLPLDPYVVGALLGDGSLTQHTKFTNIDIEIIERIKSKYRMTQYDSENYSILGITKFLRDLDLLGKTSLHKFIPEVYKYSSIRDRWDLVKGLMDTDGYVSKDNKYYYDTISKQLALDLQFVLRSLGCTVTITSKIGSYKKDGVKIECNKVYKLYIRCKTGSKLFYLERKKKRCKDKPTLRNRIMSVEKIDKDYATCISISGEKKQFITTNFIVTHNSEILTALPGRYIDCPLFTGTMVRSTVSQLMKPGNLWSKANSMYKKLPKNLRPKFLKGDRKVAIFPHGPEIEYTYLNRDGDEDNFQGAEYTLIGVDEALQIPFNLILYLLSRLRSPSKYPSRLVMSGNPDPDHEIADMISWYLDEEGYPHPEREGVTRYFITQGGEFVWSDNPEELIDGFKNEYYAPKPLSFSAIFSTIYDNPICMKLNPGYVSFLEGLPSVEKARLLYGNWFARPEGANYFKREDLLKADGIPLNSVCCRAWDKAGQIPTDVEKHPDFSACIKMYKNREGEFFISGEPHNDCHDDFDKEVYLKFRAKPGRRDSIILKQALFDGDDCPQILPQDPGAAGATEFLESAKKLMAHGIIVKKDPSVSNKSKLQKFSPFAAAVEAGFVYIVESTFPNKKTLEAFYKELEAFDGSPSTRKRKDDWVDVVATGYNYLSQEKHVPIVRRNQNNNATRTVEVLAARQHT